jgi:hypothetical protein
MMDQTGGHPVVFAAETSSRMVWDLDRDGDHVDVWLSQKLFVV